MFTASQVEKHCHLPSVMICFIHVDLRLISILLDHYTDFLNKTLTDPLDSSFNKPIIINFFRPS